MYRLDQEPRKPIFYSRLGILSLLVCILVITACVAFATQIKVETYNIKQHIGSTAGYSSVYAQALARIVNYYQPDVLTINELDVTNDINHTAAEASLENWVNNYVPYLGGQHNATYYTTICTSTDGYQAEAIVSKYPISQILNYYCSPRGILSALVSLPDGNSVRVYTVHLKADSDSSSAGKRQAGAGTTAYFISLWSGSPNTCTVPYYLSGDLNEDESNPQSPPINSSYCPITTVLSAYLQNYMPDNLYGSTKTISSSGPTRRFDYILPSWNLNPVSGQVIDTNVLYNHGVLPSPLTRYDSMNASDHLTVIATLNILNNSIDYYKSVADGQIVTLTGKTVTAVFSGYFYIEEADGSNGIRVSYTTPPTVGSLVNVTGTMAGSGAERYVSATGVRTITTLTTAVPVFWMRNKSIGGVALNSYTPGVKNAMGTHNIGLLVGTWGQVTSVGSGYFVIDDGSKTPVYIISGASVNQGNFVRVAGISTYYVPDGKTTSAPAIIARSTSDVTVLAQ